MIAVKAGDGAWDYTESGTISGKNGARRTADQGHRLRLAPGDHHRRVDQEVPGRLSGLAALGLDADRCRQADLGGGLGQQRQPRPGIWTRWTSTRAWWRAASPEAAHVQGRLGRGRRERDRRLRKRQQYVRSACRPRPEGLRLQDPGADGPADLHRRDLRRLDRPLRSNPNHSDLAIFETGTTGITTDGCSWIEWHYMSVLYFNTPFNLYDSHHLLFEDTMTRGGKFDYRLDRSDRDIIWSHCTLDYGLPHWVANNDFKTSRASTIFETHFGINLSKAQTPHELPVGLRELRIAADLVHGRPERPRGGLLRLHRLRRRRLRLPARHAEHRDSPLLLALLRLGRWRAVGSAAPPPPADRFGSITASST